MFSLGKHFHSWPSAGAEGSGSGIAEFTPVSVVSLMPTLARRNPVMIMPSIWRRSGPNKNLHDQRGALPKGARRTRQKSRRLGLTFWHRPYRANRAATAIDSDFGGSQ